MMRNSFARTGVAETSHLVMFSGRIAEESGPQQMGWSGQRHVLASSHPIKEPFPIKTGQKSGKSKKEHHGQEIIEQGPDRSSPAYPGEPFEISE